MAGIGNQVSPLAVPSHSTSSDGGHVNRGFEESTEILYPDLPVRHDGVTYTWSNVSVVVQPFKSLKDKICGGGEQHEPKTILHGETGIVRPGELLALMGASGAGKTTLLNSLVFRNTKGLTITGERRINGHVVDAATLASLSAYIQQQDIFIGSLTPREHLIFQALLRMQKGISYKERMQRVEDTLVEFGLTGCADTVIGIPGRVKGISGGQQKRLSIASELLTDAKLIILDEPTTGLDSFMAENIVKILRNLADKGKTIICTIHQPSSQVFSYFNRLLLLAEGHTTFLGSTENALTFFEQNGYPCPTDYNPADFYVQTLAIRSGKEDECKERCEKIFSVYNVEYAGGVENQVKEAVRQSESNLLDLDRGKKNPYRATWWKQFTACLWRASKTAYRDPLVLKVQLMQTISMGLFIGILYLNQELDQEGIQNINGAIFLILANVTFISIFPVANVFWSEIPVFMRESQNRVYRTDAYYFAKSLAELPVYIVMPILLISILYYMIGFNSDVDRFFISMGIIVLVTNVGMSFGFMISTISSSLDMTLALIPLFIMPFFVTGGAFQTKESTPDYLVWISYLSWFLHGNEAMSINQWKGVTDIKCSENTDVCITTGEEVLERLTFKESNFSTALAILGALVVGARLIALVGLLFKARKKE